VSRVRLDILPVSTVRLDILARTRASALVYVKLLVYEAFKLLVYEAFKLLVYEALKVPVYEAYERASQSLDILARLDLVEVLLRLY
jgi:hypothetical protein